MKKKLLIVFVFLIGIISLCSFSLGKADSGFDSDWSSSSSSLGWSSSSSSSSSDWSSSSSSSDRSSSSSGYGSSGGDISAEDLEEFFKISAIVIGVIFGFGLLIKIIVEVVYNAIVPSSTYESRIEEILDYFDDEDLHKYSNLKAKIFENYVEVQNAWMNFEYDKLRDLVTDEMFNMYSMQLQTLEIKKQKNVMKDIQMKDVIIKSIKEENGILTVHAYLGVEMYDYLIDQSFSVIKGSSYRPITILYDLTLVKKMGKRSKKVECPNCGNNVTMRASGICDYCGSTLISESDEWILSKKENIGQW